MDSDSVTLVAMLLFILSEYLRLYYCAISPKLGMKEVFFLENALEYSLYERGLTVFIMFSGFPMCGTYCSLSGTCRRERDSSCQSD